MITIVFGKPGVGKTAFLVADATKYMDGSAECRELYSDCLSQVRALNSAGACFEEPLNAPVYSNFPIRIPRGTLPSWESYYIDGFHLGFENDDVPVFPVLPSARIYLSEAQRYYNSRRSKDLPDWVSRYYEEHRHFGLEIILDVQRPGLIDINIRELCGRFVEIQQLAHHTDKAGNITGTDFYIREFPDWKWVDKYLTTGEKCYTETVVPFDGNVFTHYQSRSYYNQFVPADGFFMLQHISGADAVEDAEIAKQMYQQIPPEGFYGRSASQKKRRSVDVSDT